jgi:small subunit ribosomal protein S24e
MEIEIDSKRNNPLMNRTEVYFTVKHFGEKTPNRELVKSELADKLNEKKENIIISFLKSGFGINKTTGYAKIYSSLKLSKDIEPDHILTRNKLLEGEKKKEKKGEEKPGEIKAEAAPEKGAPELAPETPEEKTGTTSDEQPEQTNSKPTEEKPSETAPESPREETTKDEITQERPKSPVEKKPAEEPKEKTSETEKKEEKSAEEKKE